jgi:hypothetical protein
MKHTMTMLSLLALSACGFAPSRHPPSGTYGLTSSSGKIEKTMSGTCSGSWTYNADLASKQNHVDVKFDGKTSYRIAFGGVAGSPHPDGYDHASSATAEDGVIRGEVVNTELGTKSTSTGTYDGDGLKISWTFEQNVPGDCATKVTGSGNFTATLQP